MGNRQNGAERSRALWAWGPVVLYMGVIFALSSQSTLPQVPVVLSWDKLQHSTAYGVMALLALRAWTRWPLVRARNPYLPPLIITALYGMFDEFHQHFVPGRSSDPFDWAADVIGASMALGIAWLIYRRKIRSGASRCSTKEG